MMLKDASPVNWAFALLFCFGIAQNCLAADPPKSALLVAIGNYPSESGWPVISSLNDVALIKKALLKQGFSENEIHVITDTAATKTGIERAIQQYLVETAKPGGVAYFHFSGHGQQVADDNDDELDGYDEALVPINSPLNFQEGVYEGENLLRDDVLGKLLDQVRRKLGPTGNLLVVLDACHSGTGTRGIGKARGTQTKMAAAAYQANNSKAGSDISGMDSGLELEAGNLAPMVSFFGAAAHQLNFETKDEDKNGVGSLSYAFSKKFAGASPKTTYRGLFEQIKLEMTAIAPSQNPQVEGALDQEIMAGSIVGSPEFYRVTSWNDPGSVVVEAGWLHGLQNGAVLGFYSPETRTIAGATPLAKGTVVSAEPTTSTVELTTDLAQDSAMSAWVFVLEQSFGDLSISFTNSLPEGHPVLPILRSKLENTPAVKEAPDAELNLTLSNEASRGAAVQLLTSSGMVIETFRENLEPKILAENILRQLKNYGQARFLKNMEMESYELPVSFELIPIKIEYDPRTRKSTYVQDLAISERMDKNGTIRFKALDEKATTKVFCDGFRVKVTNDGNRPAYFTLLDIQPNNVVNVLMPSQNDRNESPAQFVVRPGSTEEPKKNFIIYAPLGMEVFKLIATDQPIDLRSVASSRGQTKSASQNPFEKVFAETFFNEETGTRGGKPMSMSASEVNVASLTFVIE